MAAEKPPEPRSEFSVEADVGRATPRPGLAMRECVTVEPTSLALWPVVAPSRGEPRGEECPVPIVVRRGAGAARSRAESGVPSMLLLLRSNKPPMSAAGGAFRGGWRCAAALGAGPLADRGVLRARAADGVAGVAAAGPVAPVAVELE
jgi:hypothetical protein